MLESIRNKFPVNCNQLGVVVPIKDYSVNSWTPEQDGKGKCTQVHVLFKMDIPRMPGFVLRLKTKHSCQLLIDALEEHKKNVWGDRDEKRFF
jgi:hypothetical protein